VGWGLNDETVIIVKPAVAASSGERFRDIGDWVLALMGREVLSRTAVLRTIPLLFFDDAGGAGASSTFIHQLAANSKLEHVRFRYPTLHATVRKV
jgi:hypothetical protein